MSPEARRVKRWREDPVLFVRENFGVEPDPWQIDVLRAFASNEPRKRRIAMKACKGPGKTAVLAWMIWNFLACYGTETDHPKGAATSITEDNIDDNLWPELAKWMNRSEILQAAFVWRKTRVFQRDCPETWFFSRRTWARSSDPQAQANTLAGFHGKFIFFVGDEAGGYPDALMATAEAALATEGGWAKIAIAGNPTHLEGPLYRACTSEAPLWYVIAITGDPDDPKRSSRISKQWAREQIEKYGRESPWVLVNVFGQFPPSSLNTLLGPEDVEAAKQRYGALRAETHDWSQKRLGVDVARFGDDRTVLFPRQGLAALLPTSLRNLRTTDIAARVMVEIGRFGGGEQVLTFVDDTGHWGHGVIDNLIASGHQAQGIQFHGKPIDPRFANRRAEMWIGMSEWFKRGGCIPPDCPPELVAELTVPQYTFVNGRFQLEDKDHVKQRLGRSPDLADALALTFAIPDAPAIPGLVANRRGAAVSRFEYNPLG